MTTNKQTNEMTNEQIKYLLMKHDDFCMILKYRALTPAENQELIEIESQLDALN
jgi:hypothetical protein